MYQLESSSKDSGDLSIGFYRNLTARETELIEIKKQTEVIVLEFNSKTIWFCSASGKKNSYGMGYKQTLKTTSDNHVWCHVAGIKAENIVWAGRDFCHDNS